MAERRIVSIRVASRVLRSSEVAEESAKMRPTQTDSLLRAHREEMAIPLGALLYRDEGREVTGRDELSAFGC